LEHAQSVAEQRMHRKLIVESIVRRSGSIKFKLHFDVLWICCTTCYTTNLQRIEGM